jgi:hypothetical protein
MPAHQQQQLKYSSGLEKKTLSTQNKTLGGHML